MWWTRWGMSNSAGREPYGFRKIAPRAGVLVILAGFLLACFAAGAAAEDQAQLKEILGQADRARGNLGGVVWAVHIDSVENGREDLRDLKVQAKGYNFLATIVDPAKVRGQRLLMVDRNMWFMKPGLTKPVPISARQKLVGGVSYGDIASTNYAEDYVPTQLPDERVNDQICYVLNLKAIDQKATYDRIKYWIVKEKLLGVKAEYYTVSGKMLKTALFEFANQVELEGRQQSFISKMSITDAVTVTNTAVLNFRDAALREVPDSILDVNLLMSR